MNDYSNYLVWLADGGWIRVSARAIIFNQAKDQILIESNFGSQNKFANFIGGGVETGETLQSCIERELFEETDAKIINTEYLFVVENFFSHNSEIRHSLEHYFEIDLGSEEILSINEGVEFVWIPVEKLLTVDLRPVIVRDSIIDGSYRNSGHMVIGDNNA